MASSVTDILNSSYICSSCAERKSSTQTDSQLSGNTFTVLRTVAEHRGMRSHELLSDLARSFQGLLSKKLSERCRRHHLTDTGDSGGEIGCVLDTLFRFQSTDRYRF